MLFETLSNTVMVEITRGIKYGDRTRLDNGLDSTLACDRWPFQVAVFHRKEQKIISKRKRK